MIPFTGPPASGLQGVFGMSLSLEQVQRIAILARIAVSADEARGVMQQLNRVLELIDQMQAQDARGIEPMAHALDAQSAVSQRLREDKVTESDRRAEFQAVAPAVEQGLYLVPKVIE